MPPMQLKIIKTEDGAYKIYLDDKLLHHVKDYKIESSTLKGKAELTVKMLVEFPVEDCTPKKITQG